MRLNVDAPYFLTQKFARRWIAEQAAGRVLMIGSINGQTGRTCAHVLRRVKRSRGDAGQIALRISGALPHQSPTGWHRDW